ncbi:MAG: hypothetical protein IKZ99_01705 [Salinivirgaceae bacterium]|nr:hypothetical protein [Salinivirgaceae bacterium]
MKSIRLIHKSVIIGVCVFAQTTLTSCETNNSKANTVTSSTNNVAAIENYNYVVNIKPCSSDKMIPQGFSLGEVLEYTGVDDTEQNMLRQFRSYNSALLRGDVANAKTYQYPDAIQYFKKFYPGYNDDMVLNEFFKAASGEMISGIQRYRDHGIDIELVVGRMKRKITYGQSIFYVFEIYSNIKNEKLQLHTTPDETVAVSFDNGHVWTFNAVNDDTPHILRLRYPNNVVNMVMGY